VIGQSLHLSRFDSTRSHILPPHRCAEMV